MTIPTTYNFSCMDREFAGEELSDGKLTLEEAVFLKNKAAHDQFDRTPTDECKPQIPAEIFTNEEKPTLKRICLGIANGDIETDKPAHKRIILSLFAPLTVDEGFLWDSNKCEVDE